MTADGSEFLPLSVSTAQSGAAARRGQWWPGAGSWKGAAAQRKPEPCLRGLEWRWECVIGGGKFTRTVTCGGREPECTGQDPALPQWRLHPPGGSPGRTVGGGPTVLESTGAHLTLMGLGPGVTKTLKGQLVSLFRAACYQETAKHFRTSYPISRSPCPPDVLSCSSSKASQAPFPPPPQAPLLAHFSGLSQAAWGFVLRTELERGERQRAGPGEHPLLCK